jgi:phosphoadenosine phosphosulfate reductase
VPVTPPGDARPAFPRDIAHVNRVFEDHFGVFLIPQGHLALLNKVPDTDRMEEVVIGGGVVGAVRYLPKEERWEAIPRREASVLMRPTRRTIIVDQGAAPSIRDQGASVLAPGLVEMDPSIEVGDEVFIYDTEGTCIGVGRAKVNGREAPMLKRGSLARTRRNVPSVCIPGKAGWDDAVHANVDVLAQAEGEAVAFVRQVQDQFPIQANVSYSGGKDSLVTLLVALKALGKVPLLFADTGLEFPETYENVREVASAFGLEVITCQGEERFWEGFEAYGPPAVNRRWCCKAAKLIPVHEVIRDTWGECLSFIGQRKYESARRMRSGRVWRNNHIRNQVSAAPIQHWTALHVWLYLFREHAPYNPLYSRRIDRIGCYMCPSSDLAMMALIQEEYPALWEIWQTRLEEVRTVRGLGSEWVKEGKWRIAGDDTDEESSNC